MRATAAALAILAQRQFLDFVTSSASDLRWWLIRLGCYALTRPLERATDWVWLIDPTAQIGDRKLFAVLGCRLSDVPFGRALRLADLKLIALVPMEKSNRESVAAILEEAQLRTGVPRQIVSDGGSDVRGGSERFIENHPETTWALDVVHAAANALETVWERDLRWHEFLRQLSETNQTIRQTKAAFLLAPLHRQKVRFMKVGITIRFATRVLRLLDAPVPLPAAEEKYAWLRAYRNDVAHWRDEHRIVETTVAIVRRDGLNASTREAVEYAWGEWGELRDRPEFVPVMGRMRGYLNVQTRTFRPGEPLVGSTEVLEASGGGSVDERADDARAFIRCDGVRMQRRGHTRSVGRGAGENGTWLDETQHRRVDPVVATETVCRTRTGMNRKTRQDPLHITWGRAPGDAKLAFLSHFRENYHPISVTLSVSEMAGLPA